MPLVRTFAEEKRMPRCGAQVSVHIYIYREEEKATTLFGENKLRKIIRLT